jgi:flagellar basal body rod protein FlgG
MVGMIAAMRAYEAASKVLRDQDKTLGRALSEVARAG